MIERLGECCRTAGIGGPVALVADAGVPERWRAAATRGLAQAGYAVEAIEVPAGEASKSLAQLERLYRRFAAIPLDRGSTVVALGGGMVGDLAGFAAATFLRGIALVQVPTTLLGQVDASVGGKTAIDLPEGKNLVGAFHQPRLVVCDLAPLHDLPDADFRAGLAEVVKYGVIADPDLFATLEEERAMIVARDLDTIARIVTRSCEIKSDIVARDERESDLRQMLNFGHTIGHAIEAATDYRAYRHGEAVAIGMVGAALLSEGMVAWGEAETARLRDLLAALGLPTRLREPLSVARLLDTARRDKKARGGSLRFVLARRLGEVEVRPVAEPAVRAVLVRLGATDA